jgi:aspartyl-tRNA(Asn)/glutamyl-tRNA(Gln) amidotransferase subunit A
MDFRTVGVSEISRRVNAGEVSAREVTEAALKRIEATNGEINAFVAVDAERALADAAEIDRRIASGQQVGDLAGVPIGVKDNEDAIGYRTTHGSLLLADAAPAEANSVLVERLRHDGCVVVGKTNTPEFAYMGDTDNRIFGRTENPWKIGRSPGGSSGGSAAAVAAGMVPLATGSDGGGSLRIPAALCGLSTHKPSLGRVPDGGPRPPGWADISSKGVLTRTIADTTHALDLVIGAEPTDIRSLPMPQTPWAGALSELAPPIRVLWAPNLGYVEVDREVLEVTGRAVQAIADAGTEVIEVDQVFDSDPVMHWVAQSVISNLHTVGKLVPEGAEHPDLDPGLAEMMRFAAEVVSATDVFESNDVAHLLNFRLRELLSEAHVMLTPTIAGRAPFPGVQGTINGEESLGWVSFTYPFNLTRSPAGSVCAGFDSDGIPVGLQVVSTHLSDVVVLRTCAYLEQLLDIDTVCPYEPGS